MKTNCFAYTKKGCAVLKSTSCEKCKFYKTEDQFKADEQNATKRIKGTVYEKIFSA